MGYKHFSGELAKLGHKACPTTVANVLRAHGLEPLPRQRTSKLTWSEFLKAHWDSLVATDFFSVEVWHGFKLIRYSVLFVIDLPTRKVNIIGVAPDPDGQWMKQMARNVTDAFDGPLRKGKFLIHDRDPRFTKRFRGILQAGGVTCKKLPPRSPNLNAYAERFVRSIKSECLDNFIFVSEKQLRYVIDEYVEHYNRERPHQGIGNVPITSPSEERLESPVLSIHPRTIKIGKVQCRERLGGMLKHYYRKAA